MNTRSLFAGSSRVQALRGACVIGAIAAFAAACGGGSGSSAATAPSSSASSPAAAAAGAGVTVGIHNGAYGTYLADSSGRSLYLFEADKNGASACNGACTKFWPPLTSSAAATASGGVQQAMLGTTKRSDGTTQITYAGHPLYYFFQDKSAGDTKGEGLNLEGGEWYLLSTKGATIESKVAAPAQSSSSSGGGYGY